MQHRWWNSPHSHTRTTAIPYQPPLRNFPGVWSPISSVTFTTIQANKFSHCIQNPIHFLLCWTAHRPPPTHCSCFWLVCCTCLAFIHKFEPWKLFTDMFQNSYSSMGPALGAPWLNLHYNLPPYTTFTTFTTNNPLPYTFSTDSVNRNHSSCLQLWNYIATFPNVICTGGDNNRYFCQCNAWTENNRTRGTGCGIHLFSGCKPSSLPKIECKLSWRCY